jgi:hypothetical protein
MIEYNDGKNEEIVMGCLLLSSSCRCVVLENEEVTVRCEERKKIIKDPLFTWNIKTRHCVISPNPLIEGVLKMCTSR